MRRFRLGRATLARVVELRFSLGAKSFPHTPPSGWHDNADLLVPDFFDPDTDQWHIAIQSWVIQVDGLTVIVDTGVGNDRLRPHMPPLDHLNTAFLAALRSAGVERDAVDVVVNTHMHSDHVGWNTMLDNGTWVPTFPNARYLLPAADYRHFEPDGPAARRPAGVRGQRVTHRRCGATDPVVGRLRGQRFAAAAARPRAHAGLLGALAGRGPTRGLRR